MAPRFCQLSSHSAKTIRIRLNPASNILFGLPEASQVSLEVFNIMGQRIETLVNDHMEAGYHEVYWNASAYSGGVYFYRIKAGAFSETKKMMLLK